MVSTTLLASVLICMHVFAAKPQKAPAVKVITQAPPPAATAPLAPGDWTMVTALKLHLAEMEVDNAQGRIVVSSARLDRAGRLFDRCTIREANAQDELAASKLALTDAQNELDSAQAEDDYERNALEMASESLTEERGRANTQRFERERAANGH